MLTKRKLTSAIFLKQKLSERYWNHLTRLSGLFGSCESVTVSTSISNGAEAAVSVVVAN